MGLIFLIDEKRRVTGYQSFPETTKAQHVVIEDETVIEKLKQCIGLVTLDESNQLPVNFFETVQIEKYSREIEYTYRTKLSKLSVEADSLASSLLNGIPAVERDTWPSQESEARAWLNDDSTSTPVIDAICLHRECEKPWLVQKIIEKADLYRSMAAVITAKRQKIEDQLKSVYLGKEDQNVTLENLKVLLNQLLNIETGIYL